MCRLHRKPACTGVEKKNQTSPLLVCSLFSLCGSTERASSPCLIQTPNPNPPDVHMYRCPGSGTHPPPQEIQPSLPHISSKTQNPLADSELVEYSPLHGCAVFSLLLAQSPRPGFATQKCLYRGSSKRGRYVRAVLSLQSLDSRPARETCV